ncbi:hypothetical protein JZ785_09485 [Alicyclobacillus curvatus]|nr:hypothetical protein JZ785_09485 [Alicyclobacillus curvatus]
MEAGHCIECGAKEQGGLSCSEQFEYLLVWEHGDPQLYALHFWTVGNYMIQHRSGYTTEGYDLLKKLYCEACDNNWSNSHILRMNQKLTANKSFKITNPVPSLDRERIFRQWTFTVSDVYVAGEANAIESVLKWRNHIRTEL